MNNQLIGVTLAIDWGHSRDSRRLHVGLRVLGRYDNSLQSA